MFSTERNINFSGTGFVLIVCFSNTGTGTFKLVDFFFLFQEPVLINTIGSRPLYKRVVRLGWIVINFEHLFTLSHKIDSFPLIGSLSNCFIYIYVCDPFKIYPVTVLLFYIR